MLRLENTFMKEERHEALHIDWPVFKDRRPSKVSQEEVQISRTGHFEQPLFTESLGNS